MNRIVQDISAFILTVWIGGLWMIGYLAVPTLFYSQSDRRLAGMLAGKMFETLGYVGIACGLYLLLYRWLVVRKQVLRDRQALIIVVMLAITLVTQFYIQPLMADLKTQALPLEVIQSALANRFGMWHGISSVLYLIESLLGAWLVIRFFSASSK
ncbi:MAG: DUF4149 domain-containing protein [Gallionella sp.]|nr:DUF4149 domain-containing protein [Gallionella sp.]